MEGIQTQKKHLYWTLSQLVVFASHFLSNYLLKAPERKQPDTPGTLPTLTDAADWTRVGHLMQVLSDNWLGRD